MKQAEGILFDFGGTLDADGIRWSHRFYGGYRAQGGALPLEKFETVFRESDLWLGRHIPVRSAALTATVAMQVESLLELLPDGRRIDSRRWAGDFLAETREAVARNLPVLRALSERFRLAVVSNFFGNVAYCLEELGLLPLFSVVTDSTAVGVWKPDPRIFRTTLVRLELPPSACWIVGDNPGADIEPALALGCRACWLAPADRSTPPNLAMVPRIATFPDLLDVVEVSRCTV